MLKVLVQISQLLNQKPPILLLNSKKTKAPTY